MRLYTHTHTHTHGYIIKDNKGITLIALVITIIVLLILAGVSINMITGDDGIATQASNASEKTRGGKIKEQVGLILEENKIANYQGDDLMTKEEVIEKLVEQDLLTEEEVAKLDNQDEITVGGITIDFSTLEDDGFDYLGRKYLISSLGYTIFNEGSDMTLYDHEDNILGQIPASCMTYNAKLVTISGTGDYDGNYKISDDDHYVYIVEENGEYIIGVEEGYCKHYFEGASNWVTWDFDDIENPKIYCDRCWAELPCKYINGVIYAYNISLDLTMNCVDAFYNPSIGGYCALVWDKTLETINFENQIDGVDVVRIAGFQDITDDNIPSVKKVTLPNKVKDLSYAFNNCTSLTSVPEIPNKVNNLNYTFSGCTALTDISSVTIPNSVEEMNGTFSDCTSISRIGDFTIPSSVKSMNYIFYRCTAITDISNINISNGVTNMNSAFRGCTSLANINGLVIPDSVINMEYTFDGCSSLVDASGMSLSKNVTNINDIFAYCSNLTKAPSIPNSVIKMMSAFYGCSSLTSISNIPENVINIHAAFSYCTSLTGKIYVPCSVNSFGWANCGASYGYYHTNSCTGNCGH